MATTTLPISVDGATFTASEIEEARINGSTATKLQLKLLTADSDAFDDASIDPTKWVAVTAGTATVVEVGGEVVITCGDQAWNVGLVSKYAWNLAVGDEMAWISNMDNIVPIIDGLGVSNVVPNISNMTGYQTSGGKWFRRLDGVTAATNHTQATATDYTVKWKVLSILSGVVTMKMTMEGGVFTEETDIMMASAKVNNPSYVFFTGQNTSIHRIKDWYIKSGWTSGGADATLVDRDTGVDDSTWDMSTFDMFENPDSEAGSITYRYAYGNSANPSNWSAFMTKANLRLESDPDGRYFKIEAKLTSDGAQKCALGDGTIQVNIPSAPAVDIDVALKLAGVRTVNFEPNATVQVTGSFESNINVTAATVTVKIHKVSDDSVVSTLLNTTTDLVAATPKTFETINGAGLTFSTATQADYYAQAVVSGGTPAIDVTIDNDGTFKVITAPTGNTLPYVENRLPHGVIGMSYAATVSVTDNTAPNTWSVFSGSLPTGLSLNATSGSITGTPSVAGGFTAELRCLDSDSPSNEGRVEVTITVFDVADGFVLSNLLAAIVSHYEAADVANDATIYYNSVPQDEDINRPYVTFNLVSSTTDDTNTTIDNFTTIQFDVWTSDKLSPASAEAIGLKLMQAFDWTSLSVSGMNSISVRRTSQNLFPDSDEGFRMQIDYEIHLEE